ncbi:hypothetical protein WDZ11_01840 [Roseomonas mucosa]|jgi:hypothetical protein|nr:hypothetical protein [Roseomonas sp. FDAARGOS_362]MDT8262666.1 hypothetical protein [Roseomonas sp. DSM 102946]
MTPGTAACAKTEQVLPQSQRECMASGDKGMGEARLLTFQGLRGGPTWEYRGALIETTGQRFPDQNFLRMAGHPQDGARFPTPGAAKAAVDEWLDRI